MPADDFNVSFENAFPDEMGIAAAIREVDEEENMPKKFVNDYPMTEIEDITDYSLFDDQIMHQTVKVKLF